MEIFCAVLDEAQQQALTNLIEKTRFPEVSFIVSGDDGQTRSAKGSRTGGRSRSHELIATYLEHAGSGRAWYMHTNGSAYAKRWHAKCRTSSDCAVIRHKNRADDGRCMCGEAMEDAAHVYLDCKAGAVRPCCCVLG